MLINRGGKKCAGSDRSVVISERKQRDRGVENFDGAEIGVGLIDGLQPKLFLDTRVLQALSNLHSESALGVVEVVSGANG